MIPLTIDGIVQFGGLRMTGEFCYKPSDVIVVNFGSPRLLLRRFLVVSVLSAAAMCLVSQSFTFILRPVGDIWSGWIGGGGVHALI